MTRCFKRRVTHGARIPADTMATCTAWPRRRAGRARGAEPEHCGPATARCSSRATSSASSRGSTTRGAATACASGHHRLPERRHAPQPDRLPLRPGRADEVVAAKTARRHAVPAVSKRRPDSVRAPLLVCRKVARMSGKASQRVKITAPFSAQVSASLRLCVKAIGPVPTD